MDKAEMTRLVDSLGLKRLKANERKRIEDFLKNQPEEDFFFLKLLIGTTPAQARNIMIEEFIKRFNLDAYAEKIATAIPPKRSWYYLDLAIDQFAGKMGVDEHRLFWDRMRYVLEALPQRKDYGDKYADRHEQESTRPKRGWQYFTCRHCWRTVPYNKQLRQKAGGLCFEHDFPATHSIYRKHSRLARSIRVERQLVVEKLLKLFKIGLSDEEMCKAEIDCVTTPNDILPRLVEYLKTVGHNGDRESLLWAFHGPASKITNALYKEAMEEYVQEVLTTKSLFAPNQPACIFSIWELSEAEAWLTLLERDGRRKKS